MGRIVDSGDGDNGSSSLLSGSSNSDQSCLPDIADLEKFLCMAGTVPMGEPTQSGSVATKEEPTLAGDIGHDATVKTEPSLDFDDCFSELFPDLSMTDTGIINL